MIETVDDYNKFKLENLHGDWIVHIVPIEDELHPVDNIPSILFIRNILTNKNYYFAFDHPDSIPTINKDEFVRELLLNTNIKWAIDKKSFCQLLPLINVYDTNLCSFLKNNIIEKLEEYNTIAHTLIKRQSGGLPMINKSIPLLKHKELFDNLADSIYKTIKKFKIEDSFKYINDIILPTLGEIETNGIYVNREIYQKYFTTKPNKHSYVYSQYNIYTSTGRPSNRYGGVNYAALNHSDGSRNAFTSRYGNDGKMIVIDYASFHPRIICSLTKYNIPINVDIYEYLAKLYFNKKVVDETDIYNAKQLTFKQLYGGVNEKYSHIKYLSNLKTYISNQWEFFQKNNYVLTPFFNRKITSNHIKSPSDTKLFNYILQAVEGEIAIPQIYNVLSYLKGKKTKAVLYTYDAVLYDFHKDDGLQTLNDIRRLMSMNETFPMKTYIGDTYQNINIIAI